MKEINGQRMYDTGEVAEMLGVLKTTVARLRRIGLRSVRIGHTTYTSEGVLRQYLDGEIDIAGNRRRLAERQAQERAEREASGQKRQGRGRPAKPMAQPGGEGTEQEA